MNIFYTINRENLAQVGVSLYSFFLHNHSVKSKVFLLIKDLEDDELKQFYEMCKQHASELIILKMDFFTKILSSHKHINEEEYQSYALLFLSRLLPFENKILFLKDTILFTDNIISLWDIDLSNYLYAGVSDCLNYRYLENIGLRKNDHYIETSVVLANLRLLRDQQMSDVYLDYMHANHHLRFQEKDVLNGATPNHQIKLIEPRYNAYSSLFDLTRNQLMKANRLRDFAIDGYDYQRARIAPKIINFNGSVVSERRPWEKRCKHPKTVFYRTYQKLSPFHEYPLKKDGRRFTRRFVNFWVSILPKFLILPTVGFYNGYSYPMRDRKKILRGKNVRLAGKNNEK